MFEKEKHWVGPPYEDIKGSELVRQKDIGVGKGQRSKYVPGEKGERLVYVYGRLEGKWTFVTLVSI